MDAVAEEAGVTKVTLYSHFDSKDELVAAYLERRDLLWRASLDDALSLYEDPRDKLLAVFDTYREWLVEGDLRGCAFVNCAAEFPYPIHPVSEAIRRHKAGIRERLRALADEAGIEDAEALSEQLFVIFEGSCVTAALEDDERLFVRTRSLVEDLVGA